MMSGTDVILPEATLRAFRQAAAAARAGEARTWLPATPRWRRSLQVLARRLRFAGRRAYRFVASRQASAITGFRMPVKSV